MRGRFPEETLREIRDRANILEVVSAHVGLKRVGRNHVGLCPFHSEKTGSFTVNEDRGIFHCFGCGAGGNVFTFLMKIEALSFPEVVERLAGRYGVTLPARGEDDPAARLRESLFRLNDKTARFYARHLWETSEAAPARAYLAERGITRPTAERFLLGYAPASGSALVRKLGSERATLALGAKLGLVTERRDGGHFDRFRARVIFPITDSSGRVVGFGSRSVPGTASETANLPKYLNSPETPLYRKGSHLYGLALARDAIRGAGRAIVVEGYFDVLALVEAGIANVVASLGTALTSDQLKVLKRFSRDIVVFFDGDAAGQNAAEKSLPLFLAAGLWGHGAFLPPGDDPDTFVRRVGRDAAAALLADAIPLLDFYLDRAVRPDSTVAERSAAAPQVARLLGAIHEPSEYEIAIARATERLRIPEELLRRSSAPARPSPRAVGAPARDARARRDMRTAAERAEEMLVSLMLRDPAAIADVEAAGALDLFESELWRALAQEIVSATRRSETIDTALLLDRLDDAAAERVVAYVMEEFRGKVDVRQMVQDCVSTLRQRTVDRERNAVVHRVREAERSGDETALERDLRNLSQLRQAERT